MKYTRSIHKYFNNVQNLEPLNWEDKWHTGEHLPWLVEKQVNVPKRNRRPFLDLSVEMGQTLNWFKKNDWEAVGFTTHPEEKEKVKARCKLDNVQIERMHMSSFSSNYFAGVVAWRSLAKSISPYILLREIHRLLVDKGRLLLYIPPESDIEIPYYYSVLNPKQTLWLIKRTGFEVKEFTTDVYGKNDGIYKAEKVEFDEKEFCERYKR